MARSSDPRTSETGELRADEFGRAGRAVEPRESETERIARRAYQRFEERGGEHGHDQEDWFAAEEEVRGSGEQRPEQIAGDVDARRLEESARGIGGRGVAGRRRS